jgi:protein-S-isoprenylcysteine O-methyltransferase Ste14
LERRVNAGPRAEKENSQKIMQVLATIAFIAVLALPAFDHRLCWSPVPSYVAVAGDVLVVLGLLIVFPVFKENTYTAGVITVETGQKVISTGPYARVRHPMYAGSLVMLLGVPLALGSSWGLITFIPITIVIVWRLLEEEKFLLENLPGYSEYRNRVRYRLVPYIW